MPTCHNCGSIVEEGVNSCPFCGTKIKFKKPIVQPSEIDEETIEIIIKQKAVPIIDEEQDGEKIILHTPDIEEMESLDDEEQIMQIAKEMDGMSQAQRKKLVKEKKDNPEADIEEIIEKAKSGEKIVQVVVTLTQNSHLALKKLAKAEETNQDEAAAGLIEEGLASKGFLESE